MVTDTNVIPVDSPQTVSNTRLATAVTNENQYRALFDASPISLWEEDFSGVKQFINQLQQDGVANFGAYFDAHPEDVFHCIGLVKVIDVNQRTMELYKAGSKEELLANLATIFGEEAFDVFKKELILISNGGILFENEGTNYTLDGDKLYVHVRWSAVPGYEDTLSRVIVSILDITDRKQMEKKLRRQLQEEELLSQVTTLIASAQDMNVALEGICAHLARFYGVPQAAFALLNDQLTGAKVVVEYLEPGRESGLGFVIPVANNPSMAYILEHQTPLAISDAQSDPLLSNVHEIMRQRQVTSLLIVPVIIQDQVVGTIGFDAPQSREFDQEDIALGQRVAAQISQALQRKRAEQELQAQRDFAHQVMNNMGQGLIVTDAEWHIEYSNPAFAQLLGVTAEDLIGKPAPGLLFAQYPELLARIRARWLDGQTQAYEIPLRHADGSVVHILMTAVPRWRDGQVDGTIAVMTDLTKRKQIETSLASARDNALEASRLKSEFLANMSHEIRTPLNAVIGMTSLLLDTPLNHEQQEFATTIRSSGDVLLSLINDILDFSKIEAGKLELENQSFDLRDCVEAALDVVASNAAEKGLEMAYVFADQVPQAIVGDVTRLRQVLVNLLGNAVKFTDQGEIVIRVDSRPPADDGRHQIQFSVQDTGIGIPEHHLSRLFKSFSQVDASTTRKYGGTGLGLAISKRLVEMMDGRIWVNSEVGKGSTFHFSIQAQAGTGQRLVYLRGNQPQLAGKRLLIVDDNETNRMILTKQASLWGMLPQAVASGPQALALLHENAPFDVAVLDMHMPEMDGLMLAAEIRRLRDQNALPLVMLSSVGNREGHEAETHFATFLTKPVKPHQLYNSLISVFDHSVASIKQAPQKLQIDPEMGQRHPLRILLAEDNLVNQKVALRILERMGYRADVAANGLEALEALQRQPYDIVLMDVQMPDMDGVEATQQIREIWPPEQQPRIIAMTAHALTGDREKYLDIGMDDYISKPVRIQELLYALANSQPLNKKQ